MFKRLMIAVICSTCLICATAEAAAPAAETPSEAVDAFHNALRIGDTAAALSLLARNLVVIEFGVIDPNVQAYAFSHMPFDMDMAGATSWTLLSRQVGGTGDTRYVLSKYHVNGLDATGATIDHNVFETAIVTRVAGRFRISHLHWSTDNPGYEARAQKLRLQATKNAAKGIAPKPKVLKKK